MQRCDGNCQTVTLRRLAIAVACALLSACEPAAFKTAREAVSHDMRDPASAQFRDVHAGFNDAVCGEVNAKNAMGAYVGFRRFAWSPTEGPYIADEDPTLDGEAFWVEQCTPAGPERDRQLAEAKRADSVRTANLSPEEAVERVKRQLNIR